MRKLKMVECKTCVFCNELVRMVNDCGVCKNCWCPEGEILEG
jgi:hypothetical protein